jgi:RNA polymerase sigma-70 factor, ECF subfamily
MEPHELTDAELLARIPSDAGALDRFYRRHAGRVLAFAFRRCSDPDEAADVVSAVFLRVIDRGGSFDPERGTAPAWLLGIAVRELADLRRDAGRRRTLAERLGGRITFDESEYELAEQRIDAARAAESLRRATRRLTASQREILLLVAADGLTPAEAASALGISPLVARVRLARARRRAQAELPAPTVSPLPEGARHVR